MSEVRRGGCGTRAHAGLVGVVLATAGGCGEFIIAEAPPATRTVVVPAQVQLPVGDSALLKVTAYAANGSDVTAREFPYWTSLAPEVARVDSVVGRVVWVVARSPGRAVVRVTMRHTRDTAVVVVTPAAR